MHTFHDPASPLDPGERLGRALDQCLDGLLLHGQTLEQCLEQWPDLERELEPLLRVALELAAWEGQAVTRRPRRHVIPHRLRSLPPRGRRRAAWGGTLAGLLVGLMLTVALLASPQAAAALVLSARSGDVEVYEDGAWRPPRTGQRLEHGALLRTGADGRATLQTPAGVLHIEANTLLRLPPASSYTDAATDRPVVCLDRGRAYLDPSGPPGEARALVIETPFGTFEAAGAALALALDEGQVTARVAGGVVGLARDPGLPVELELGSGSYVVKAAGPWQAGTPAAEANVRGGEVLLIVELPGSAGLRLVDPHGSPPEGSSEPSLPVPRAILVDAETGERRIFGRSPHDGPWQLLVEPAAGPDTITFIYDGEQRSLLLRPPAPPAGTVPAGDRPQPGVDRPDGLPSPAAPSGQPPGRGGPPVPPPGRQ